MGGPRSRVTAEPVAAADRAAILLFRGALALPPARLLSLVFESTSSEGCRRLRERVSTRTICHEAIARGKRLSAWQETFEIVIVCVGLSLAKASPAGRDFGAVKSARSRGVAARQLVVCDFQRWRALACGGEPDPAPVR
jgi:hypothetical protein